MPMSLLSLASSRHLTTTPNRSAEEQRIDYILNLFPLKPHAAPMTTAQYATRIIIAFGSLVSIVLMERFVNPVRRFACRFQN